MAEELKHLLDRIQKDGVDKAESQAQQILEDAKAKGKRIVEEAETAAKQTTETAAREAEALAERGAQSLRHAARDVILSIGATVTGLVEQLVSRKVESALTGDTLATIVTDVVKAYCAAGSDAANVALITTPDQQEALRKVIMSEFGDTLAAGMEISSDDGIAAGFRVAVRDEHVEHDFTAEAVSDALCELLRPHLAEIVKGAMEADSKDQ